MWSEEGDGECMAKVIGRLPRRRVTQRVFKYVEIPDDLVIRMESIRSSYYGRDED